VVEKVSVMAESVMLAVTVVVLERIVTVGTGVTVLVDRDVVKYITGHSYSVTLRVIDGT
jgi:hypothetical protein